MGDLGRHRRLRGDRVMTAVAMVGVGVAWRRPARTCSQPIAGALIIGIYAAGAAGVGFAVGGLFRNTIAGEVVAVFVIATFLIDFLAPALSLPDWVHQLALTSISARRWSGTGTRRGSSCAYPGRLRAASGRLGMTRRDVA